ncbi:FAD-dependent 2-octaprenylphenol hydroxylase [Dickeya dianthicola]|uniref:FAD-dependent 2-octaprenylphenol hydroxylase n=1 Tax=Dickeya dianthicola TaxID=204039 RepID=UPI0003AA857F|nr:FAD-dependent 2-octaprenylphenol hydroxylase [Dickeya dianthicola]ATO31425.1 2-octaprenyl-3-methyl-6-methoxy-1,4-benzoquino hydroxylase [Dickeya dianthicola RNS04.9]MBT1430650.1 FAD-dependent 2-octaprenylphenol hydroxylase [Dickeya dianthicola]MCA7002530.1 FAD-dependent 2-octaprenylphenol hydroxylase [Dickeya dianthicola]MCI4070204.1 FAD-dependent 2-octaprenylphenol hydroxylase [Dickeya dianthicola]MCI4152862.1 FAD-dependent 2-octaprenylphenol hydroxylase [Dickeya dianthicola]
MQSFDVVIAGGGMVGLALACGLQGSGLSVAVLEKQTAIEPLANGPHAPRVSAINAASEALLRKLDVWPGIAAQRLSPYNEMYVWDKDSFGNIRFCGEEFGFSRLGHIIENDVIQWALWQQATQSRDITLLAPAALRQVAWGENEAFITLEDGSMLTARLVVGADGAHSWLRQHADIPLTFWDYGHHALVANIRTERPHGAIASQVFHGDGILAFLPLGDPHLSSIVWSLPPERAQHMHKLPADDFVKQLAMTFDMRLGLCQLESDRQTFPLTARYARSFAAHRLVLTGDAAHTIHPLAGQGVNLGFMDVAELIAELKRLQAQGKDIGQHLYLRRYERRRKHSAALMLASMQSFRTLFAASHPVSGLLRDIGLKLADTLPGIKPTLVRQAMGLNDLPEWLDQAG